MSGDGMKGNSVYANHCCLEIAKPLLSVTKMLAKDGLS